MTAIATELKPQCLLPELVVLDTSVKVEPYQVTDVQDAYTSRSEDAFDAAIP